MNDADIDYAASAAGITSPIWLPALNEWITLVLGVGGLILLGIRIWKNVKKGCHDTPINHRCDNHNAVNRYHHPEPKIVWNRSALH